VPRAKTNAQMLAELDELYRLGYRGHVDFVDDNLIGNKKAVKAFLPELAKWLEVHDYPFEFTTEASINLADDAELLALLNRANFVGVFVGIESPDTATLIAMRKKQNTRRSIAQSIHKIYAAGLFVQAGFIIGFDSETQSVADAMVELIEEAAIPVCMVGLLYALPNTQLTRRLEKEGRLHPHVKREDVKSADQCTMGLNFATLRPRQQILADYVSVLDRIYDPVAYAGRLQRLAAMLDNSGRKRQTRAQHSRRRLGRLEMVAPGYFQPARTARSLSSHADPVRCEQSEFDQPDRVVDNSLPGRWTVLARRDRTHREHDRRARAGRRTASADRAASVV